MSEPRIIHRRAAIADGWSDAELRTRRGRGELVPVRRGIYVPGGAYPHLAAAGRYRLAVIGAAERSPQAVLSHVSAAAVWDLPLWGLDLKSVHFTRARASGGRRSPNRHDHTAQLAPGDVTSASGVVVTSPARTIVDLARCAPAEAVIVVADHALHAGLVTPAELTATLDRCRRMPGIGAARRALCLADGRSESVGESRTRVRLTVANIVSGELRDLVIGLELQIVIRDEKGQVIGRVDLGCLDQLTLIEFDGLIKYAGRLGAPNGRLEDVLIAEKAREDALRALGYLVIRIVWKDLEDIAGLRRRVLRTLEIGRKLHASGVRARGSALVSARIGL
jgi:hypothetical protein